MFAIYTSSIRDRAVLGYELELRDLKEAFYITATTTTIGLAKYKKISEPDNVFDSVLIYDIGKLAFGMM